MATGIVRRIDELGRIVIPKEIRRTMNIKEGDALEIKSLSNHVVIKKYTPDVSAQWNEACQNYIRIHSSDIQFGDIQFGDIQFHMNGAVTTCVRRVSKKKTVGMAYLNPEDKNNPTIGCAIALCRALYGQDCDYMKIIGLEG